MVGLGPIGEMACRIAVQRGVEKVIGVDLVPERLARAASRGVQTVNLLEHDDVAESIRELTDGRGADAVIDAVGMEAHGAPVGKFAQDATGLLPDKVAQKLMTTAGVDRLASLMLAIDSVRRATSGIASRSASTPKSMLLPCESTVTLRLVPGRKVDIG